MSDPPSPSQDPPSDESYTAHFGPDGYARFLDRQRPETPSSYNTFSITSTMDSRIFREDEGRLYQARNDDYQLPADERERERLDVQHFGIKASQGDKNYLAPIEKALPDGGKDKRLLDIGTGSGVWLTEIAREFPDGDFVGLDLAPTWKDTDVPDNVQFVQEDASQNLPFPDCSFDVVHGRGLASGIRNWTKLINQVWRVLKPGGLFVSVDVPYPWPLIGIPESLHREKAPGFMKFVDYLQSAIEARGCDTTCGATILKRMRNGGDFEGVIQIATYIPLWEWSQDYHMKKSGRIMLFNAQEIAETCRLMICDGCGISGSTYEGIKQEYLADLNKPGANSAIRAIHTWGYKLQEASKLQDHSIHISDADANEASTSLK